MVILILVLTPLRVNAAEFKREDGDRVVLIGSTLIEREQKYGYLETALTCRFPDQDVTFRNLGWSGDTVWGESRAGFDAPATGYRRLVEETLALKPTVIIIGYGTNESFAGEADHLAHTYLLSWHVGVAEEALNVARTPVRTELHVTAAPHPCSAARTAPATTPRR